jgi:hypothetical protein
MVCAVIVLAVNEPIVVSVLIGTIHLVAMAVLALVAMLSVGESIWGNAVIGFAYIDLLFLPAASLLSFGNEIVESIILPAGGTAFHGFVGYTLRRIVNEF